ncbi:MAG: NrdJb [Alteromonadaceae bacterium]|uniref:TSCPD domain-containing protein n=1 Tax=unclassified Marinobacter TaxID=83889 RepID=UPI000C637FD6|nr:NrdJb [Marinobacter sp. BGYM27]MAA63348.1 NrdJb [Alteromonadaceae bacterium]MBH85628.1 NrdJb [Alteromonadaceae bacterium]MDG5500481.1 NrdJb [Marinobacter sp. BGYM27]|tara:strand:- start:420 stop:1106 length:687 start_codon:yes stop_codon:yes gene_type:complete
MTVKIDKKIVGYRVIKDDASDAQAAPAETQAQPVQMNEYIARPDFLLGTTYKIKPPIAEHAMYITINDILLNEDTDHESRQPYEVFINSKSMEHFQWVIALTRVISAVFRKGGDVTFLVEELRSVYDPNGGYFKKGGVFMPSLVAEIGAVIEKHMKAIGLIESDELGDVAKRVLAEKRAEFESRQSTNDDTTGDYPSNATLCGKCNTKAVIVMDGCATCLSCGDSKCG